MNRNHTVRWAGDLQFVGTAGSGQSLVIDGDKKVGMSPMEMLLLQGLAHSYAGEVIELDVVESRLEKARELGAGSTYNLSDIDADALAKELHARSIDTVIDATGDQRGLDLATRIVKRGGLLNLFGWIKGNSAAFGSRLDRGWVPPTVDDLEAEEAAATNQTGASHES